MDVHDQYRIVCELVRKDVRKFFVDPIDPVDLDMPNYSDIVARPMDLSTVASRVSPTYVNFERDVRTVFRNAKKYTSSDSVCHQDADRLLRWFDSEIAKCKLEPRAPLPPTSEPRAPDSDDTDWDARIDAVATRILESQKRLETALVGGPAPSNKRSTSAPARTANPPPKKRVDAPETFEITPRFGPFVKTYLEHRKIHATYPAPDQVSTEGLGERNSTVVRNIVDKIKRDILETPTASELWQVREHVVKLVGQDEPAVINTIITILNPEIDENGECSIDFENISVLQFRQLQYMCMRISKKFDFTLSSSSSSSSSHHNDTR